MFAVCGPPIELSCNASGDADSSTWTGLFSTFSGFSCLGDESMVVGAVVAVLGLSLESADTAAADVGGNLPVNSSFLIRDFSSSSSSQTVSSGPESADESCFGSELSAGDSLVARCKLV